MSLQKSLTRHSGCLSRSKKPNGANNFHFTKRYQVIFWTKGTQIVIFYLNNFDVFQFQHQLERVGKDFKKFHYKYFVPTFLFKSIGQLYPPRKNEVLETRSKIMLNWHFYVKAFDQASKTSHTLMIKTRIEIGSTISIDSLVAHCCGKIFKRSDKQTLSSFNFEKEKTNLASF